MSVLRALRPAGRGGFIVAVTMAGRTEARLFESRDSGQHQTPLHGVRSGIF